MEVWDFPVAAEEFHQWSYQLCVGEYIDSAILQCPFTDEQVQQMVVWRDRMPQAVAVDGVECHAEERSGKSGNDVCLSLEFCLVCLLMLQKSPSR